MTYRGGDLDLRVASEADPSPAVLGDTAWADEPLAQSLAHAQRHAASDGADRVRLAHLLYAFVSSGPISYQLVTRGIDAARLSREIFALVAAVGQGPATASEPPRSVELEQTLSLASRNARQKRSQVSVDDVLDIMLSGAVIDAACDALQRRRSDPAPKVGNVIWTFQPQPSPGIADTTSQSDALDDRIRRLEGLIVRLGDEILSRDSVPGSLAARLLVLERAAALMTPSAGDDTNARLAALERVMLQPGRARDALAERVRAFELAAQATPAPVRPLDLDCSLLAPKTSLAGGLLRIQALLRIDGMPRDVEGRQARLSVALESSDLLIKDPIQLVPPHNGTATITFPAIVPLVNRHRAMVRVMVRIGQMPFGVVTFPVAIADAGRPGPVEMQQWTLRRFRQAYASFASEDRAAVQRRLASSSAGLLLRVAPSDPVRGSESEVMRQIDEADLFLMFWSRHAIRSARVLREAEYALARQQRQGPESPVIVPVMLDALPPAPRPESLQSIDFSGSLLHILATEIDAGGERRDGPEVTA